MGKHVTVRFLTPKIHGIYYRLPNTDTTGFNSGIGVKAVTNIRVDRISHSKGIVYYAADNAFLLPMKIKVESGDFLYKFCPCVDLEHTYIQVNSASE